LPIFGEKIGAFFSKSNVMIKNLHNLALFWVKNANYDMPHKRQVPPTRCAA
jgi:hypothetical protein